MLSPGAEVRRLFPGAQNNVWLNAAASSPLAQPAYDAMRAHLDETLAQADLGYPKWAVLRDRVRARLAKFVGVGARDVAFISSTSFGIGVLGQMLQQQGVREVVTLESEFPSTTVPLLHQGLVLRAVKARADGSFQLEDLESALAPSVGAVVVSAVQFASGFRIDLERLGALCHSRSLPLIINAAQAAGQVPIDLKRFGAKAIVGTSHKWLAAGYGLGWLALDPSWSALPKPLAGWQSVTPEQLWKTWPGSKAAASGSTWAGWSGAEVRADATALETGGPTWISLAGFDAALALFESVGVERVQQHNLALQRLLRAELRQRGFRPNAPDAPEHGSGICVVPVEGDPLEAVRALIHRAQVITTPRGGGVRISTHLYNTEEDVDALVKAIDRLGIRPSLPT